MTVLPYGSWPTPITSELIVRAAATPGAVAVDGDDVWWSESRPSEGGRTQIVRNGVDVLSDGWNARSAVHEYGGGAWWVRSGVLWFVRWDDQRLYRLDPGAAEPVAVTPEPEVSRGDRYADGDVSAATGAVVCVRERHLAGGGPADVTNEIVVIDGAGAVSVLVSGPDFVSSPRWSPDGAALCWVEWDHPDMPWDATRLMVRFGSEAPEHVAGGPGDPGESVQQPTWQPDGSLWFLSDRTGWWNLYRWPPAGAVEPVVVMDGDIGQPPWVFGRPRYAVLPDGRVVFAYTAGGFDHMAVRSPDGAITELDLPYTSIEGLRPTADGAGVVALVASPTTETAVVSIAIAVGIDASATTTIIRPPRDLGLDDALISTPEPITFPTAGGATAHALYYEPCNPGYEGPPGQKPPLLVLIHGGPTAAAQAMLRLGTQYWTSRGFAVVDVDYRGSTGYGRPYRDALLGQWGIADVEDCIAAARWLADQGRVDPERLCIRGGSAGGFTVLAALASSDAFAAGASHYGIADLEALARDTHKFESHYTDRLIAPYPEHVAVYTERSPIEHLDGFDRPLIVLQGLEDQVVPPNQAEMIVAALADKHVPVAYVAFEGEQHGFRKAENIRRALDAELSFYAQVLGFEVPAAEGIEPVEIRR